MRALRGDSLDLRTFSYIADTPAFNEERWIDVVVGASKASPWKIGLTPQDFMADFDRLLEAQGEPIQEPAAYPQHRVFGLARGGGVKVILTGEGGDELFGGYTIFLTARLASLVRRGRVLAAARLVEQARRLGRVDRARDVVLDEGLILPRAVRELIRPVASEPLVPSWLDGRWFAERGVIAEPPPQPEGRDALHEKLHLYLTQEKLPRLLRYGDRNSMAFSLECRLPFLTPQLARFVSALPEEYLIAPDGTSKAVFRRAMRGIVPDEILDRRDKVGFQMPIPSWLPTLGPWLADLLDGADPAHVAPLRLDEVRSRWQPGAGAPALSDVYLLWRCANVVRWADRFAVSFEAS
jgi:asparagine synthase (glutamine-hydrolysing)